MAKDNLFLGMGRGSIGDVVFYRANGVQVARSRNRHPANPNSFKQQVQRAIMANVARLYSAGREIFDHSWQGRKVGSGSQRGFLAANNAILRSLVVRELNEGITGADCNARVGAPSLAVGVPYNGMQVSYGSYPQRFFFRSTSALGISEFAAPLPVQGQTVAQYAQANGLVDGDLYTFVGIGCGVMSDSNIVYDLNEPGEMVSYKRIFASRFSYVQLRVKDGILGDDTVINEGTTLAAIFDLARTNRVDLTDHRLNMPIDLTTIDEVYPYGVLGCIRSREDSGLRSESYAYFSGDKEFGLTPDYISRAWSLSAGLAGSDLILEGENFQVGGA